MSTVVVTGAQWGGEGKGRVIDIIASQSDVVIRSQGGNNSSCTIEKDGEYYVFNLVPSGILYPEKPCLIGCGTVINPKELLEEIERLKAKGFPCANLVIDPRAHVVMPWHIALDGLSEVMRGKEVIGTTGYGIGPCYTDKAERSGIRICELIAPERFAEHAYIVGRHKNEILTKIYNEKPLDIDSIVEEYIAYGKQLSKYVADVSILTYNAIRKGRNILFEGAQGSLLDINVGTYPYATSSSPVSGGVCTGTGIGPTAIDKVIGVAKAYTTRIGQGPFPTELFDDTAVLLRKNGNEFGSKTQRPRRIGWFDSVILRHSVRVNGITELALNKLDVLRGLPVMKICTAYRYPDGSILRDLPASLDDLKLCSPIYDAIDGFSNDIGSCTKRSDLPDNILRFIDRTEQLADCKISLLGVGPSKSQIIDLG